MRSTTFVPPIESHRQSEYVDKSPGLEPVLDALADPICRTILETVASSPMTVRELAEACDLPLSTTYRKVEVLTEASLLRESVRICEHGKHPHQYERSFGGIFIHATDDGSLDSVSFDSTSGWLLAVGED